jgi:hypothetical protein
MSSVVNNGGLIDRENLAMVLMQHPKASGGVVL